MAGFLERTRTLATETNQKVQLALTSGDVRKMSEVLAEWGESELELLDDQPVDALQRMLIILQLVWNVASDATLSNVEAVDRIDEKLRTTGLDPTGLRRVFALLVRSRREDYADDRRLVMSVEAIEDRTGRRIAVAAATTGATP